MGTTPAGQGSSVITASGATAQPLDQLVLIETVGGNTIYNANDPVLTLIGNTPNRRPIYTFEKAGNLRAGQQVAFDKDCINISLERIAEALSAMPAYAAAQAEVFLKKNDGKLVPRFQHLIIQGLWQKAMRGKAEALELPFLVGMSEEQLNRKVLKEQGEGFTPNEYNAMARVVHGYLALCVDEGLKKGDGSPIVVEQTVREWVRGETDGPRERDVFYALSDINPAFERWFQSLPGQESPWDAYRLWVTVRQGLRHKFETIKARGSLAASGKESENHAEFTERGKKLSLTAFMQHVLDRIYHEQSPETQHADLIITGVTKFGQQRLEDKVSEAQQQGKTKPHLYMGLCKEKPEGLKEGAVIPYSDLPNLLSVFSEALAFAFYRYLRKPEVSAKAAEIAATFGVSTISERTTGRVFLYYEQVGDRPANQRGVHVRGSVLPKELSDILVYSYDAERRKELMSSIPERTRNALLTLSRAITDDALSNDGKLDTVLGLEKGTVAAAVDLAAKCNAALPQEYFDLFRIGTHLMDLYNRESLSSNRDLTRQIRAHEKEADAVTNTLKNQHGITRRKMLMTEYVTKGLLSFDQVFRIASSDGNSVYEMMQEEAVMVRAKTLALQSGQQTFLTREEAKKLLDAVGLVSLLKIVPNRAFIDQIVAPLPLLSFS